MNAPAWLACCPRFRSFLKSFLKICTPQFKFSLKYANSLLFFPESQA